MYARVYHRNGRQVDSGQADLVEPPGVGRRDRDDCWVIEWEGANYPSTYHGEDYYVICYDESVL